MVAWYQHHLDQRAVEQGRQREALVELAALLFPLVVELERPLQARGYWVGDVRELRRLGTWIVDPAQNAQQAPNWERIKAVTQEVEQRWWGGLQVRITDPELRRLREEFYGAGMAAAMPDIADPRGALARLAETVEAILNRIGALIGEDFVVAEDRPPRHAAPELRHPMSSDVE